MTDLLNVDDALAQVLDGIAPLPAERVKLSDSLGRVLAEDLRAEVNLPPFPNSALDGYAVRAADVTTATPQTPSRLLVVMDIPAGKAPKGVLQAGQAARIMTGAPLPEGADAVIPVENTDARWMAERPETLSTIVQIYRSAQPGDGVRQVGDDLRMGQRIVPAGSVLRAQEIGVLASLGQVYVPVIRQPRVAIISTGDELVDIHEPLSPGKIRDSNSYMLAALVTTYGGTALRLPVARDTLDDVRRRFRDALDQRPDVILSSAGVSVGAFDVVRTILEELGQINFWRINLRPGKPLAFGHVQGVPFFGLPGNPVSAIVTFDVFVRPVLLRLGNRMDEGSTITVTTGQDIESDGRRSYLRVKLVSDNGQLIARLTGTQISSALISMVLADGLLIVPEGVTHVPAGTPMPVRLLRYMSI